MSHRSSVHFGNRCRLAAAGLAVATLAAGLAVVGLGGPVTASQRLCTLHQQPVPENSYGVTTGTYLEPGQSVQLTGGGAIWAGVWLTGTNGPEGWFNTSASSAYPLPGAREYSLLARANGGWSYIGQYGTVTNTGSTIVPLQLRTNDNIPGNGSGAFTATYTTCYTDGDFRRAGHANGVRAMASAAGRLYAVTNDDKLWVRDPVPQDSVWTHIGQASGVRALAGTTTQLYAATTGNQLVVRGLEPWNVPWTAIGHAYNVTTMTLLGGKLYAVTSDGLLWDRDLTPADINWRQIGSAVGVRALGASATNLYGATTDNNLWLRPPAPVASWTYLRRAYNVTGLASAYGYLFASTSDNHLLYRTIPATG
ncbi:hypothetical protein [Plantactinospora endophytica]|uniref:Tat pathway signal sequence domain protein n=1 Tax=Plantactinospora endophytica TaxID=673535 RepID=A0ABQ4E1G9_9ACTN|nr:hypothetical protein [Plantactinospora endophytica]GIG88141.1 hypothetical protein Pen02_30770 [Plantactinospora endophytica]